MKFELFRTDINKRVVPPMDYADEQVALGQYISALMMVGILQRNDSGLTVTPLGQHKYRLANGWELEVRKIGA